MMRILAVLACLALGGCVQSAAPLDSGGKVTDPRLIGDWKSDLDGDPMIATFREDADGNLVADVQAYWEPGPKAATQRYEIVLARFGEQRYASFRNTKLSPDYALAGYVFQGKDRFCLHAASTEQLAADLETGKLPGKVVPDRHMRTLELSATPEQLRSYFADHGISAFDEQPVMAFERVSSAVLPPPRSRQDRDADSPGFNEVTPCRQ